MFQVTVQPHINTTKNWLYQNMVQPTFGTTKTIYKLYKIQIIKMNRTVKTNGTTILNIKLYSQGIQLGKTIATSGSLRILGVLYEKQRVYTELLNETELPGTSLNRALKLLLSTNLIKTEDTFFKGRKTSIYIITSYGKELMKFINKLERDLSLKASQKTLVINNTSN